MAPMMPPSGFRCKKRWLSNRLTLHERLKDKVIEQVQIYPKYNARFFKKVAMHTYNFKIPNSFNNQQKQWIFRISKLLNKQNKQWITFKVSALEMRSLEEYCQQNQRTKTDILREQIRRLPTYTKQRNDNPG